ncbi:MAG TPA: hypothetical protein DCY20_04065, partial [Firmicutes bacterium]|nr:hypothetical protein [Bacillota bacterium]
MNIVMISLMAFFNLSFGTEQTPNINEVKSQVIPTQKSVSENELIQKLEEHKTTTLENNQNSTIEQQSTQKSHTKTLEELIGEELLRIVIENTTSILPKTESTLTVEPQTELATVS